MQYRPVQPRAKFLPDCKAGWVWCLERFRVDGTACHQLADDTQLHAPRPVQTLTQPATSMHMVVCMADDTALPIPEHALIFTAMFSAEPEPGQTPALFDIDGCRHGQ